MDANKCTEQRVKMSKLFKQGSVKEGPREASRSSFSFCLFDALFEYIKSVSMLMSTQARIGISSKAVCHFRYECILGIWSMPTQMGRCSACETISFAAHFYLSTCSWPRERNLRADANAFGMKLEKDPCVLYLVIVAFGFFQVLNNDKWQKEEKNHVGKTS